MLNEVKVYKPNRETKKLELDHVISRERVSFLWDAELNKSRSHKASKVAEFKASGRKRSTAPDKYTPNVVKKKCQNCNNDYYATNRRNNKFCSQRCGRIMSNEYKKERERLEREKRNANSTNQRGS